MLPERLGEHHRGGRENRVELLGLGPGDGAVQIRARLRVHERRVVVEGALEVDDRGLRIDLDLDRIDRVLREVAGIGHNHGDRLADAADVAVREHAKWPVATVGRFAVDQEVLGELVEVGGDVHGRDSRHGGGCRGVDRHEGAAGKVTASERDVQRVRQRDVVDVTAPAAQESSVFVARHALADEPGGHGRAPVTLSNCSLNMPGDPLRRGTVVAMYVLAPGGMTPVHFRR